MLISTVRLHELLASFAGAPQGLTADEFRAVAFPDSQTKRGARRMMTELAGRGLIVAHGMRHALSPAGLELLRSGEEPAPPAPATAPEPAPLAPSAWQIDLLEFYRAAGVRPPPPPPSGPWSLASDGLEWCRGADGSWWHHAPGSPPRTRSPVDSPLGAVVWEALGLRVFPRPVNYWQLPIGDDRQPIEARPVPDGPSAELVEPPPMAEPAQPWTLSPHDGRWWSRAADGAWWTLDAYGTPVRAA